MPEQGHWQILQDSKNNSVYEGRSGDADEAVTYYADALNWHDYAVELKIKFIDADYVHIRLCSQEKEHEYLLNLDNLNDYVSYYDPAAGAEASVTPMTINSTSWYTVHFEIRKQILRASINGHWLSDFQSIYCQEKKFSLTVGKMQTIQFDDIRIWSLNEE